MCNPVIFVYLLSIFQSVYLLYLSVIVLGSFSLIWLLCQRVKSFPLIMNHLMLLNCCFTD